ncbi:LuxR C-terminal-related transcriptional regulator [Myxococcaceae bacterium GXIMD 01537]
MGALLWARAGVGARPGGPRDTHWTVQEGPEEARPSRSRHTPPLATCLSSSSPTTGALGAQGLTNKDVAQRLGTTEKTIKAHRARVIQKLDVDSVAK